VNLQICLHSSLWLEPCWQSTAGKLQSAIEKTSIRAGSKKHVLDGGEDCHDTGMTFSTTNFMTMMTVTRTTADGGDPHDNDDHDGGDGPGSDECDGGDRHDSDNHDFSDHRESDDRFGSDGCGSNDHGSEHQFYYSWGNRVEQCKLVGETTNEWSTCMLFFDFKSQNVLQTLPNLFADL
jgi:hypothetical protein